MLFISPKDRQITLHWTRLRTFDVKRQLMTYPLYPWMSCCPLQYLLFVYECIVCYWPTTDKCALPLGTNLKHLSSYYLYGKRKNNSIHTRLRHQCSSLNYDLYRCNRVANPSCRCGYPCENSFHFFLECPLYVEKCNTMLDSLDHSQTVTFDLLLSGDKSKSLESNIHIFQTVHVARTTEIYFIKSHLRNAEMQFLVILMETGEKMSKFEKTLYWSIPAIFSLISTHYVIRSEDADLKFVILALFIYTFNCDYICAINKYCSFQWH